MALSGPYGPASISPVEPTSAPYQQQQQQPENSKSPAQSHTRTYQACIPCRRRKVRCNLGPVDNPHDPPCQRCRRESKECFFSSTRRKRKGEEDGEGFEDGSADAYEIRNGRKRARADSSDSLLESSSQRPQDYAHQAEPVTPGGPAGLRQPLKRTVSQAPGSSDEEDQAVNNSTAAILQRTEVYNSHDALHMLYEAAGRNGDIKQHRTDSQSSIHRPTMPGEVSGTSQSKFAAPLGRRSATGTSQVSTPHDRQSLQATGGAAPSTAIASSPDVNSGDAGLQDALKAWNKLRFVRAGWFTATEAVSYIDYFYRFLSPLTPITVPNFHNPLKHAALLAEEPMLAITLLAIASRYMALPGPGATSRKYAIHEKLWTFLKGLIDRMIWAQEQFGGGFCGAGLRRDAGANNVKGLRSLGTVESLLLLTEWHTRALHFPPGDDNDELIVLNEVAAEGGNADADSATTVAGRRIDSWLEPIWRSDRMCWSLLANALALSYELGVFDKPELVTAPDPESKRKSNIKRLLCIYITQTSGRLSLPSFLSDEATESIIRETAAAYAASQEIKPLRPSPNAGLSDQTEVVHDSVLYFWSKVASIVKRGNHDLFPSRERTRHLITSGEYDALLTEWGKVLSAWKQEFEACTTIPQHMRHILNIEFEYTRVYINSLGLQAVVERCTNNTPSRTMASLASSGNANSQLKSPNNVISSHQLRKWMGGDHKHIREIVLGSQNLLRSIIDGLLPGEYLKHSPVRTYYRVISVSMILLKTFALGATEEDVSRSLSLLDRAAEALSSCIVDDVHVANHFATLLGTLTHRVRSRMIRVAAKGTGSTEASRAASPTRATSPSKTQDTSDGQKRPQPNIGVSTNGQGARSNPKPNAKFANTQPYPSHPNAKWSYPSPAQPEMVPFAQSQSPYMARPNQFSPMPTTTHSDPLHGIATSGYDPHNPTYSIMPPPYSYNTVSGTYDANNNVPNNATSSANQFATGGGSNYSGSPFAAPFDSDWFALPLDPLINSYGADVGQTSYGPELGGQDMLDLLLTDPGNAQWGANTGTNF